MASLFHCWAVMWKIPTALFLEKYGYWWSTNSAHGKPNYVIWGLYYAWYFEGLQKVVTVPAAAQHSTFLAHKLVH